MPKDSAVIYSAAIRLAPIKDRFKLAAQSIASGREIAVGKKYKVHLDGTGIVTAYIRKIIINNDPDEPSIVHWTECECGMAWGPFGFNRSDRLERFTKMLECAANIKSVDKINY